MQILKTVKSSVSLGAVAALGLSLGLANTALAQTAPETADTIESTATGSIVAEPVLKSKLSLRTGILGSSKEDRFMNSKYVGGSIALGGEASITEKFSGRLAVGFLLTSGSFSNLYSSEGKAPNVTYLDEAVLEFRPIDPIALQAGIVMTDISPFTSTLDSNGFPGMKESLSLKNDYVKTSFMAIQAMPVSTTATVKNTEAGVTSTFLAYGAEIATNPEDKNRLTLQASLSHFEFNDLTTSAALDSEGTGNTIVSGRAARFIYGFAGTEGGLGASFRFSDDTTLKVSGTLLRNDLAPTEKNLGYIYSASLSFFALSGKMTTSAGYFYNESDTLPSTYTSSTRGFNNRFGQFVSFRHELRKQKLTSFMRYTRVNEIEDRPMTDDRNHVSFGLEVAYDVL